MKFYEDYDYIYTLFSQCDKHVDETAFYFGSDTAREEHYIGYLPQYEKPFWAGLCDVPDGCEFASAEELFNAKIYGGQSIRERWQDIHIFQIGGISIDDWVADDYVCKEPAWRWALVGNIIDEHSYGEEHETRRGTKQFAPGAKVYLAPGQWGDGYEKVFVIGKPRHQRSLIKIIMPQRYIENFRLQKVFNPRVLERMREDGEEYGCRWWGNTDADRDEIIEYLDWLNPAEAQKQREKLNAISE